MKLKRFWFLSLMAICMPFYGEAQPSSNRYARVDAAILSIPDEYTKKVDTFAEYINRKFKGDEAKMRAIYVWMTHRMAYNVFTTFTSRNEVYSEEKEVQETLSTRKGVCRQFALLFKTLAGKVGIKAYLIDGYGKSGNVVLPEVHEWCVAQVNGEWYFFDPTYDTGYIEDYRFVSAPDDVYFKQLPERFIQTHMPFDPLWQFLKRPYSYSEFEKGVLESGRNVPFFCWQDSLKVYDRQSWVEQLEAARSRILANGKGNDLVDYFLQLNQANTQVGKDSEAIDVYAAATDLQNRAVDSINVFIRYRKAGFRPRKAEAQVRRMIEVSEELTLRADSLINSVHTISSQYKQALLNLRESIMDLAMQIYKHKLFLERYYATKPSVTREFIEEIARWLSRIKHYSKRGSTCRDIGMDSLSV